MKVIEVFASIQGEGRYIGRPSVFIRLAGCNLRCSWCDTKYAFTGGKELSVEELVYEVNRLNLSLVCITGGEPMLQIEQLRELVGKLQDVGHEVVVETNGTLYDEWVFDAADCVSMDMKPPSSGEESDIGILKKLKKKDQVKIVVAGDEDFEFAKDILKKTSVEVILQPVDGANMSYIAEKVTKEGVDVRVLPQLHKLIGVR
ncbi:7-carboxy-7-deazaguanine synthase QueE [Candidatus Altiarchaeota archaeon]